MIQETPPGRTRTVLTSRARKSSDTEPLSCVLCRSGQEPVVVNLDLPNVEPNPEKVEWIDNIHPGSQGEDESR